MTAKLARVTCSESSFRGFDCLKLQTLSSNSVRCGSSPLLEPGDALSDESADAGNQAEARDQSETDEGEAGVGVESDVADVDQCTICDAAAEKERLARLAQEQTGDADGDGDDHSED